MICHRVAILSKGRLMKLGRTEDLLVSRDRYEIIARGIPAASFELTRQVGAPNEVAHADGLDSVPRVRVHPLDANLGPGGRVQVTVPAPSQREALEKIWALGGEVLSVNPVRRTLEEVFLELTNDKGADA